MGIGQINPLSALTSPQSAAPPAALVAQFESILKALEQQINAQAGVNQSLTSQIENFIRGADNITPDQKLDAQELARALNITPEQAQEFINTFNKDNDNALDAAELASAVQAREQAERAEGGEAGGGRAESAGGGQEAKGAEHGGNSGSGPDLYALLRRLLDKNRDGKIDAEELKALDKDDDGKITKEEFTEGIKELAEQKGVTLPEGEELARMIDGVFGDKENMSAEDLAGVLDKINEGAAAERE